jgi:hypothetical protein
MKVVYVVSKEGKPLMPTKRYGKVRHMLRSGKAEIISYEPFTIRLLYDTPGYIQQVTLGIDTGTKVRLVGETREITQSSPHPIKKGQKRKEANKLKSFLKSRQLIYRIGDVPIRKKKELFLSLKYPGDSIVSCLNKIANIQIEAALKAGTYWKPNPDDRKQLIMSSESELSKTIVTVNLPNKADRQGSKDDQEENKDGRQIFDCLSILSKASGGLKDSKIRTNDRWERVKDREGSGKK